ncbi:MAG: hypothetical protein MUC43_04890 [Pirellula sp.]|nr:hypothetical protein [Pirellula sp.]
MTTRRTDSLMTKKPTACGPKRFANHGVCNVNIRPHQPLGDIPRLTRNSTTLSAAAINNPAVCQYSRGTCAIHLRKIVTNPIIKTLKQ